MMPNNLIYSLLNTNTGLLSYNQLLIQPKKHNMTYPQVRMSDHVSINTAKQYISKQKMLSSITAISGHPVEQLAAVNNTLMFNQGCFYKYQNKEGKTVILTTDNKGNVYMPYDELNLANDFFTPAEYGDIEKVEKFFTYLSSDMSAYCVRINYTKAETKDMLATVGIKPGWFEIKNGPKSNKYYMLDDGTIYPEYQVEATRLGFNMCNFFDEGYTKESIFIVDGQEYKLDDTGHLHIPEGTGCLMENIKMIK